MASLNVALVIIELGDVIIFTEKLGEPSPFDSKIAPMAFASLTQPCNGEFG